MIEKLASQIQAAREALLKQWADVIEQGRQAVLQAGTEAFARIITTRAELEETFENRLEQKSVKKLLEKLNGLAVTPAPKMALLRAGLPPEKRANNSRQILRPQAPPSGNGTVTGPELKILTSLAELEALGLHPSDKQQLGLMAGYTNVRSGGFSEPLGRLIGSGYATSPQTGRVAITDAGRAAVGHVEPPATPEEMQARILAKLTGPEQKLLRVIIARYPERITKEELGAECGYTNIRSGGFSEPLGRLNTLGIIETPARGEVAASPALFLEGVA